MTLRLDDEVGREASNSKSAPVRTNVDARTPPKDRKEPAAGGALADALRRAGIKTDNKATQNKGR